MNPTKFSSPHLDYCRFIIAFTNFIRKIHEIGNFPTVHSKGDLIMCEVFFSEWNSFKCQSTISISESERDAQPPSIPFDAGTMDWLDKAPSQINLKSMSTVLVRVVCNLWSTRFWNLRPAVLSLVWALLDHTTEEVEGREWRPAAMEERRGSQLHKGDWPKAKRSYSYSRTQTDMHHSDSIRQWI